jgi:multidrug resistance efflux pump
MSSKAELFCQLFSGFCLVVRPKSEARSIATKDDLTDMEEYKTASQVKNMLKKATEEYNRAKKLFKANKISKEELFDCEWRVFELKDELDKLNNEGA